jgi:hypothetical protein
MIDQQQLREKAHLLAPILVTDGVLPFAERIAQPFDDEPVPTSDAEMREYVIDALTLTMHLVDRLAFGDLGREGRDTFMDELWVAIADGIDRAGIDAETFRNSYNQAQPELSKYRELLSTPPKGSLLWEWSKQIAKKHRLIDGARIVLISWAASDYFVTLAHKLHDPSTGWL